MTNKLKILGFSICLAGFAAFEAVTQQTTALAADASPEANKLRQEIRSLFEQEGKLHARINNYQNQIKPLNDGIKLLVSQIKPLREQITKAEDQLIPIHKRIEIDERRLRQLPENR